MSFNYVIAKFNVETKNKLTGVVKQKVEPVYWASMSTLEKSVVLVKLFL